jgi:hypothetical protein
MKNKIALLFVLVLFCQLFLYKEAIFQEKIVFPSNFLAQFYSPWSTQKFEGWERGIPHKPIGIDQIRFFYPGRSFTNSSIEKGKVPLWNPYIFSGNPHMADFQSAVFYPLNLFYLFLPQLTAWSILVFIQPLLAVVFTYLFLRQLSIQKVAAFFGAFVFGFSGFMIVWGQENAVVSQAALWLPLILFGIEGFFKTKKVFYFLIGALAIACSFLAGYFQISFYLFILAFFYGLLRISGKGKEDKFRNVLFLVGIFIFAFSLSAIQLFPSIEAFFASPRPIAPASYLFETYLLPFTHVLNILAPDIFGSPGAYNFIGRGFYHETLLSIGIVPLLFAMLAFVKFKKNPLVFFFGLGAVISFFLTTDSPLTRVFYRLPLPFVSAFLPSRIIVLATFCLAVLSAFGLSFWLKNHSRKIKKSINPIFLMFFILLFLVIVYGLVLWKFNPRVLQPLNDFAIRPAIEIDQNRGLTMVKNAFLPLVLLCLGFMFIKLRRWRHFALAGIMMLALLGQFYFLNKYLFLGYRQFLYPQHPVFSFLKKHTFPPYRFVAFGEPIVGNISTYEQLFSPEGLDPIFSKRYGQLLFATRNNGLITDDIPRIEATLSDLDNEESLLDDKRRLRLLSLLGVKYLLYYDDQTLVITPDQRFPQEIFKQVWHDGSWYVFEYTDTFPRAFFANDVTLEKDPQKIVDNIFNPDFDLRKNVILEEKPSDFIKSNGEIEPSLKIETYEPEKVVMAAKTDATQILFLSDNYYPGWQAFIDGAAVKIHRSNYTFRSVVVPKGEHTISFVYKPMSYNVGKTISLISLFIFLIMVLNLSFLKKQRL